MLYELITVSCPLLGLGRASDGVRAWTAAPDTRGKLFGCWRTDIGPLGRIVALRGYATLDELNRESVSQGLDRVRHVARHEKKERFTALLRHIDADLLRSALFALKRGATLGVDRVTWRDYEADLEPRLLNLHDRVQRGAYRAQPARRTFIPKCDGSRRPLAISSVEDKVVQRAAVEVLNAINEEDFLGFSYGSGPDAGRTMRWTRSAWGSPAPR